MRTLFYVLWTLLLIGMLVGIGFLLQKRCNDRVYNMVMKYAPDANTILDLGCGSCCTTKKLQQLGKKVLSLDVVDKGVCMKPTLFNGKDIPFGNKQFDLGICSFVLHHTQTQKELLFELKRTCKKILILEDTPATEREWNFIKKHAESDWGKCIECFKDVHEWEYLMKLVGLDVVHKKTISKWDCPFSYQPWFYPVTSTAFVCH